VIESELSRYCVRVLGRGFSFDARCGSLTI
jgi:hypothetical protein